MLLDLHVEETWGCLQSPTNCGAQQNDRNFKREIIAAVATCKQEKQFRSVLVFSAKIQHQSWGVDLISLAESKLFICKTVLRVIRKAVPSVIR